MDDEGRNIINLVAFCVLMENGEGVVGKSPDYIQDKFIRYVSVLAENNAWQKGLDIINAAKVRKWIEYWMPAGIPANDEKEVE